jgi:hypothetical protein
VPLRDLAALSHDAVVGSRRVDDAVRHYLSETGNGANLRSPVVRAANRATWVRLTADIIADIRTLPPAGAYPSARALLEAHLDLSANQISGRDTATGSQMPAEFTRALRAEASDQREAVEAAQPLVTVAANLAQLELVSAIEIGKASAETASVSE